MDDTVSSTSIPSTAEENSLDYTGYYLIFRTPFPPKKLVHSGSLDPRSPPPPPINFVHASHSDHVDKVGHVAAAPSHLACPNRGALPSNLS